MNFNYKAIFFTFIFFTYGCKGITLINNIGDNVVVTKYGNRKVLEFSLEEVKFEKTAVDMRLEDLRNWSKESGFLEDLEEECATESSKDFEIYDFEGESSETSDWDLEEEEFKPAEISTAKLGDFEHFFIDIYESTDISKIKRPEYSFVCYKKWLNLGYYYSMNLSLVSINGESELACFLTGKKDTKNLLEKPHVVILTKRF